MVMSVSTARSCEIVLWITFLVGKYWFWASTEDVYSNITETSPKDPIWPPRRHPNVTFWGGPKTATRYIPIWRSRNFLGRLIGHVSRAFSGHQLEDFQSMSYGRCGAISWMFQNLFLLSFLNSFCWLNVSKINEILKVYLEPSQTSQMELSLQN